jgi:hypothetical protein
MVLVALSWITSSVVPGNMAAFTVPMVGAYAALIVSFYIDFKKVKPLRKPASAAVGGKKSGKQLKHEQEAAAAAAELEAARKAAKATKKTIKRTKQE